MIQTKPIMKNEMKGVILVGGLGTRMGPLTLIANKHLLPVYDQQMIMFPLKTLINSGVNNIVIVSDKQFLGDFCKLLGSGQNLGASLSYNVQDNPKGGIADALKTTKEFVGRNNFVVILGDNIFEDDLDFGLEEGKHAKVFVKEVADARQFGTAEIKDGKIVNILEKSNKPPSNMAVLGAYAYTPHVFSVIENLSPSERGELEITDVNNYYAKKGGLCYQKISGFWADAGTFDGLLESSIWRKSKAKIFFKPGI